MRRRLTLAPSIDDSFSHRLRIFWDFEVERKMALEVQKYFMKKMFQIGHTETVRPSLKVGFFGRKHSSYMKTDSFYLNCRKLRTIFAIWLCRDWKEKKLQMFYLLEVLEMGKILLSKRKRLKLVLIPIRYLGSKETSLQAFYTSKSGCYTKKGVLLGCSDLDHGNSYSAYDMQHIICSIYSRTMRDTW